MLAKEKQMRMGTGGGPFKKCTPDLYLPTENVSTVESLIQHATNIEIQDVLDSDTLMLINHGKTMHIF